MEMTNEQSAVNLNLNILTTLANKNREGEVFQSEETNIPLQVFGLNTNYFLSPL